MSADPQTIHTLSADANVYAYVHGAVLRATDPFGLDDTSGANPAHDDSSDDLRDRFINAGRPKAGGKNEGGTQRCRGGHGQLDQEEGSEQKEASEHEEGSERDPAPTRYAPYVHSATDLLEKAVEKGGEKFLGYRRPRDIVVGILTDEGEGSWGVRTFDTPIARSPRLVRAIKRAPHVLKVLGHAVGAGEFGYWVTDYVHALATGDEKEADHAVKKLAAVGAAFTPGGFIWGPALDKAFEHLEAAEEREANRPVSIDWTRVNDYRKLTATPTEQPFGSYQATAGQQRIVIQPIQSVSAGQQKFFIVPIKP